MHAALISKLMIICVKQGIMHLEEFITYINLFLHSIYFKKITVCPNSNRSYKLIRILNCYVRLFGICAKQFKNYFINSEINVICCMVH